MEMSFHSLANKTRFALGLALKKRRKATQKGPIERFHSVLWDSYDKSLGSHVGVTNKISQLKFFCKDIAV